MTRKKKKIFVIDTNVPLHDPYCLSKFNKNDIVIPIQVIAELDNFKKGHNDINHHSREFCRILDDMSHDHIFNGGVLLGRNLGSLKICLPEKIEEIIIKSFPAINVDEQIINLGIVLQKKHPDQEIIIVSKDTNLRLKAKALGVTAQDYLSDSVVNTDFLEKPVNSVRVSKEVIDSLFKSNDPIKHFLKNIHENEYCILKSGNSSVLVRYSSGYIKKIVKDRVSVFGVSPKNAEQAFMMDALLDKKISLVTVEGKAGTGKNFISLACALAQIKDDFYKSIYFSVQTIPMGNRDIGFLPGDVTEKINPYFKGFDDNMTVLKTINGNLSHINNLEQANKIIKEPLAFIRGRSLPKILFIIDEAQNLTPHEVKTIVTRAGEGTKIVFIGDTRQIDNPYLDQRSNGFSYLIEKFVGQECYAHVRLIKSERSPLAELAGGIL